MGISRGSFELAFPDEIRRGGSERGREWEEGNGRDGWLVNAWSLGFFGFQFLLYLIIGLAFTGATAFICTTNLSRAYFFRFLPAWIRCMYHCASRFSERCLPCLGDTARTPIHNVYVVGVQTNKYGPDLMPLHHVSCHHHFTITAAGTCQTRPRIPLPKTTRPAKDSTKDMQAA